MESGLTYLLWKSMGRVILNRSSVLSKSAGSTLWYLVGSFFLYLFCVNVLLDLGEKNPSLQASENCETDSPTSGDNYFKRRLMHIDMKEVYVYRHERSTLQTCNLEALLGICPTLLVELKGLVTHWQPLICQIRDLSLIPQKQCQGLPYLDKTGLRSAASQ